MVQLDSVKGMSGILQPGDQVTMLVQTDGTEGGAAATAAGSASAPVAGNNKIQFLYSNVEVMAIGSTGASATGSTAAGAAVAAATGPITFRVPLQAAEKIALIGSKLYLTLEPEGFVPADADLAPLDWTGVFTGEKTPYKKTNKTDANSAPTTSTTVPAANG
jgi:hypothetical protein